MNSIINNYSVEGVGADGRGNGQFFITKSFAKSLADEVVSTHFGWKGEKKAKYLKEKVPKIWKHVDVLGEGFIDAAKGPIFVRHVLAEPEISNGLQVQLEEEGALTNEFRPLNDVQQPWSAKPKPAAPGNAITGAYKPTDEGVYLDYKRVVPDRFSADGDDLLMKSLISKYALEGKENGAPTGKFYMDKSGMEAVSREVIGTHLGFSGKKKDNYMNEHFDNNWSNYDVNKEGFITVDRAPTFLRKVLGEVEIQNGL